MPQQFFTAASKEVGHKIDGLAYAAAVVGPLIVFCFELVVTPMIDGQSLYILYLPTVLVAASLGGLRPALTATLFGLTLSVVALQAVALRPGNLIAGLSFLLLGPAIGAAGERIRTQRAEGRARQAHLQSILDTVPEAMIVIDDHGVIRSFSQAAEHLFGWATHDIIGRNVNVLMPTPDHEAHDGYLRRYLETGERRIIGLGRIVVGLRRDGSVFPMELAIGEARVGDLRFFTGFVRDLTERRDQERRFQELQSELVHVSRLTAMGEMASSIAHELNQPLGAVANFLRGASRMLDGEAPDVARARVGLDRAGAEALRAGEIIKRLREFVAKGDTEQALEDPARLLEEGCALALVGARERGVRVGLSFDRSLGAVLVDKVQIQQVVFNLVRNAIEAVEAVADPAVRVTLRRSKGQALITVSDNGPGVSPAVAARLFQPFVTSKTTGMGVGLSICRTIVEAQGGRIWLRPNAPGGAEFNFTLPLAEEVADDA